MASNHTNNSLVDSPDSISAHHSPGESRGTASSVGVGNSSRQIVALGALLSTTTNKTSCPSVESGQASALSGLGPSTRSHTPAGDPLAIDSPGAKVDRPGVAGIPTDVGYEGADWGGGEVLASNEGQTNTSVGQLGESTGPITLSIGSVSDFAHYYGTLDSIDFAIDPRASLSESLRSADDAMLVSARQLGISSESIPASLQILEPIPANPSTQDPISPLDRTNSPASSESSTTSDRGDIADTVAEASADTTATGAEASAVTAATSAEASTDTAATGAEASADTVLPSVASPPSTTPPVMLPSSPVPPSVTPPAPRPAASPPSTVTPPEAVPSQAHLPPPGRSMAASRPDSFMGLPYLLPGGSDEGDDRVLVRVTNPSTVHPPSGPPAPRQPELATTAMSVPQITSAVDELSVTRVNRRVLEAMAASQTPEPSSSSNGPPPSPSGLNLQSLGRFGPPSPSGLNPRSLGHFNPPSPSGLNLPLQGGFNPPSPRGFNPPSSSSHSPVATRANEVLYGPPMAPTGLGSSRSTPLYNLNLPPNPSPSMPPPYYPQYAPPQAIPNVNVAASSALSGGPSCQLNSSTSQWTPLDSTRPRQPHGYAPHVYSQPPAVPQQQHMWQGTYPAQQAPPPPPQHSLARHGPPPPAIQCVLNRISSVLAVSPGAGVHSDQFVLSLCDPRVRQYTTSGSHSPNIPSTRDSRPLGRTSSDYIIDCNPRSCTNTDCGHSAYGLSVDLSLRRLGPPPAADGSGRLTNAQQARLDKVMVAIERIFVEEWPSLVGGGSSWA